MNKFQWICKIGGMEDTPATRWRVFIEADEKNLQRMFEKHLKIVSELFKHPAPSESVIEEIRDSVVFICEDTVPRAVMAWALAKKSYLYEEIYGELWSVCMDLEKRWIKKLKRKTALTLDVDNSTLQDTFIAALSSNLAMTRIIHVSMEEAAKTIDFFNKFNQNTEIDLRNRHENIEDDEIEEIRDSVIQTFVPVLFSMAYRYTYQMVQYMKSTKEKSEIIAEQTAAKKQARQNSRDFHRKDEELKKLRADLEENRKILDELKKEKAEKICGEECNNPLLNKQAKEIRILTKETKDKSVSVIKLTEENKDLNERLAYYTAVHDVLMNDYMAEDSDQTEELPDDILRERLAGYRVVIYGGHERWRTKIKSFMEASKIYTVVEESFSSKQRPTDIIIYNMCSMSHTDYWRYKKSQNISPVKTHLTFMRGTGKIKSMLSSIIGEMT